MLHAATLNGIGRGSGSLDADPHAADIMAGAPGKGPFQNIELTAPTFTNELQHLRVFALDRSYIVHGHLHLIFQNRSTVFLVFFQTVGTQTR